MLVELSVVEQRYHAVPDRVGTWNRYVPTRS
jgi:hypothetical protein